LRSSLASSPITNVARWLFFIGRPFLS